MKVSLHRRSNRLEGDEGAEETSSIPLEDDDSFTVYLLQFLAWPDHGTPSEPSEFLDLLFNISSIQERMETTGPMIVHCSSGIGRTGTLIVVDMLIGCVCEGGLHTDIDIARTVQAVREQRSGMVQTEAQYRFIYKAVQEFVSSLLLRVKERNALKPLGIDYTNLKQTPKSEGCLCCTGTASLPNTSSLSSSLPNSSQSFWSSRSTNCRPKPTAPPLPPLNSPGDVSQSVTVPSTTYGSSSGSRRWYKLSSASR
ncbi:unnamed protein product [Hymenolepis diminuta]|nr:unnamed protein product [Hymenolepis diminuta]